MTAKLLSGIEVAEAVIADVRKRVEELARQGVQPGLGTILVGDDGPSTSYVRKKHEACENAGIRSFHLKLSTSSTQQELLDAVHAFNKNDQVDGYIIQYPVPKGMDFNEALMHMSPAKDADGLHPVNLGKLVLQETGPVPCTPAGIQAILVHYGIEVAGKEVVIIGRGPTLGRPLSLLLTTKQEGANAAVTVVHSGIKDLGYFTRRADIVISATGVASIVMPEMIKPGAAVISGGISWEGKRLMPDVDESVAEVAGWITPRLGGVGPTTVAMLLRNTVLAAEKRG
ncbi:bifunctional protein FolD protein [bacterium BMS3Bbin11]|nr:bifunctional protein FolD protein [bacterium BMS3Abin11]GBE46682.1 bifunctional protein FolD protein [bacterium BMS3Bbin11]GMT41202.1 MAG: bifunctional protein FolD [bacterium]HDH08774.1 bifunctional 5,10-methylenetetrahydrofolate dehydrogenase/5,10-methenyltetrahydrofolate cyclohydrolase [Gammaproteobacteria bacterium]HDH15014.1 bifunctional 5,10-methylenetetrahydrofolate dehydrogenase/5,10-methenyltetrahydrofolate cyclohydrolase [Gammaproteobacteria bacterium]